MEPNSYLRLIWASKKWLLLFAVVVAVAVYLLSSSQEEEFESSALGQIVSTSQASGDILSEEQLLSLANVYHELAATTTVLEQAHDNPAVKGNEEEFDESVDVSPEARVGALRFSAVTGSPELSAEFANAYASAFAAYLGNLQVDQLKSTLGPIQSRITDIETELADLPAEDPTAAGLEIELQALQDQIATQTGNPGDSMRIVEQAAPDPNAVAPSPKRDAVLAFIVALVLGAVAVFLRDLLFDRYGSANDVSRDLNLQLLGEIPRGSRDEVPLESFRSLRTAIVFTLERAGVYSEESEGPAGTVLVTGAESGCGKSYVSANIARTLASEGRGVTIVDGDLRRPTLSDIFRSRISPGLTDLLIGSGHDSVDSIELDVPLLPPASGTLKLLPAGTHAENAVESLSSDRMKSVVQQLRAENDMVVFDSPPTLVVVDPVVLARYADGVVFVVDAKHTRRRDARRAVEALRATGAPLLGFAFNRSNRKPSRYDAYRPAQPQRRPGRSKETRV